MAGRASASSAGQACVVPSDPPVNRPERIASTSELAPLPHVGFVALDTLPSGRQVVTHSATIETLEVESAPQPWSIMFDDDGFGALINDGFDPPKVDLLEDRFKFQLWADAAGEHYIVSGSDVAPTIVRLGTFPEKWVEVQLAFAWGASRTRHELTAVLFKWHRYGSRLFISLTDLYQELGLQQFNGRAWRWTQGCKKWDVWLNGLGLPDQVAYSNLVAPCKHYYIVVLVCMFRFLSILVLCPLLGHVVIPDGMLGGGHSPRDALPCLVLRRQCFGGTPSLHLQTSSSRLSLHVWELMGCCRMSLLCRVVGA